MNFTNLTIITSSVTTAANTAPTVLPRERIAEEVLWGIIFVVALYLVICQCWYQWRTRSRRTGGTRVQKSEGGKLAVVDLATIATLTVLILTIQIEMRFGTFSDLACSFFYFPSNILINVNISCLYLALWLRQRAFYTHNVLKHLSCTGLRVFSHVIIGGVVVLQMTSTVVNFYISDPHVGTNGCSIFDKEKLNQYKTMLIVSSGFFMLFQLMFLSLVLYPLVRQYGFKKLTGQAEGNLRLRKLVCRLCISTGICVTSNVLASFLITFALQQFSIAFWCICFTYNLGLCAVAVQCSYTDFLQRLLPPFLAPDSPNDQQITASFRAPSSSRRNTPVNAISEKTPQVSVLTVDNAV